MEVGDGDFWLGLFFVTKMTRERDIFEVIFCGVNLGLMKKMCKT